ncbi:MAG: nucleotidyltransferase domain-containing protein [Methanomicrobiales archaeon]|nr:nucleotidyltransferase domain-containing protein [Methanomicrobiales archaeon]MDI6876978.1 nucleotidyltransferase domain-containing protein [Methanomicrobiales archaeon]
MLEMLISSETRVQLLTLFLLNPGNEYYIREIERLTGKNYNIVRNELNRLKSFGLIKSTLKGKQLYYTVNQNFFLYEDLQKIVLKTEGVSKYLKDRLADLETIECIFIYGSFASGKAIATSDIDLFIVGEASDEQLIPTINECEKTIQREINYTLVRRDELLKRMKESDPFVTHVMNGPKVVIFGDCNYG